MALWLHNIIMSIPCLDLLTKTKGLQSSVIIAALCHPKCVIKPVIPYSMHCFEGSMQKLFAVSILPARQAKEDTYSWTRNLLFIQKNDCMCMYKHDYKGIIADHARVHIVKISYLSIIYMHACV